MDIFKVILAASIAGSYVYFMFFYWVSEIFGCWPKITQAKTSLISVVFIAFHVIINSCYKVVKSFLGKCYCERFSCQ